MQAFTHREADQRQAYPRLFHSVVKYSTPNLSLDILAWVTPIPYKEAKPKPFSAVAIAAGLNQERI